jgi:hypothetical protein
LIVLAGLIDTFANRKPLVSFSLARISAFVIAFLLAFVFRASAAVVLVFLFFATVFLARLPVCLETVLFVEVTATTSVLLVSSGSRP